MKVNCGNTDGMLVWSNGLFPVSLENQRDGDEHCVYAQLKLMPVNFSYLRVPLYIAKDGGEKWTLFVSFNKRHCGMSCIVERHRYFLQAINRPI